MLGNTDMAKAASASSPASVPGTWPGNLLGSIQLFLRVMFRPAAWADHVHSIDPGLEPNFCLLEINKKQWKNPALRRLVLQVCGIFPFVNAIIIFALSTLGVIHESTLPHNLAIIAYVLTTSLVMASGISLPASMVYSISIGYGLLGIDPANPNITGVLALAAGLASSVLFKIKTVSRPISHQKWVSGIFFSLVIPLTLASGAFLVLAAFLKSTNENIRVGNVVSIQNSLITGLIIVLILILVNYMIYSVRLPLQRRRSLIYTILITLITGVASAASFGTAGPTWVSYLFGALAGGLVYPTFYAIGYSIAYQIGGIRPASIAAAISGGLGLMPLAPIIFYTPINILTSLVYAIVLVFIGFTYPFWRPIVEYPLLTLWNGLLFVLDTSRPNQPLLLLRLHPAFWDEMQYLPWYGLDNHLSLLAERDPAQVDQVFPQLSQTAQAWAVRKAQIEISARALGQARDLESVALAHHHIAPGTLPGPVSSILQQFSEISQDIEVALRQANELHSRALLGKTRSQLQRFYNDLMISSQHAAGRFLPIANHWLRILNHHIDNRSRDTQDSRAINNPYIFGNPLDTNQVVFVGRSEILMRVEQFLLDTRHAPLMLYGQRRMGKTSLLLNLGRVLPSHIIPSYIDFQACISANNYTDLLYNIIRQEHHSVERQRGVQLPEVELPGMDMRPLLYFNTWLDNVESYLEKNNKSLLLKLDEIETLEEIFRRNAMAPEPFFNSLRHSIQHRPRFKFILAGSHTLAELQNWSNYLINTQLIKIGNLEQIEARQLIERPIPDFKLRYQAQAVQSILDLTRAHPYLVQMVCYELVSLKNKQPATTRYLTTPQDVEKAARQALLTGGMFFADYRNQVPAAALPVLNELACSGAQACLNIETFRRAIPDNCDTCLAQLLQRDILEACPDGYRFHNELVRRWFSQNSV